jgi:hypothetical protein
LDWDLLGESSEANLEGTPRKFKGRRELLNLESSINYDTKDMFGTRNGYSKKNLRGMTISSIEGINILS